MQYKTKETILWQPFVFQFNSQQCLTIEVIDPVNLQGWDKTFSPTEVSWV